MKPFIDKLDKFQNKTAFIFANESISYIEFQNLILQKFQSISKEIPSGKVVAILSDYSLSSLSLFFALYLNNNIVVPITSKIKNEIDTFLEESNCNFYFSEVNNELILFKRTDQDNFHNLILQLQNNKTAGLILFSSGTTGKPKAMIHNLDNLLSIYENRSPKNLIFLIFLMFDHIGGLNTLFNCISSGITMIFPSSRDPEIICGLIEKHNINVLPASPTFLNLILISEAFQRFNLNSLKLITYGTEPMPVSLLNKLKSQFKKVKFLQTFGTSETGISQVSSKSSESTFMRFDDPHTEIKIVDGELYVKSKTQILGYLNHHMNKFTTDGWFKTGDLVEQTSDGFLKIIGRNSDIINVGGEKVLPNEVESVLLEFPKVKDCVVSGENHPITGQIVTAKVFYSENVSVIQAKKEIQRFCIGKLDSFKIPVKIELMSESEFTLRFKKKRTIKK